MYAQINYQEYVGNSKLTVAEIGCFVTADSNILEKVGIKEAPDALNAFYEQHNLYQYDLTDRANDDITWSTVTKFCPQLVVAQVGTSGWPNEDLAIVEFRYRSHTGAEVTHFCVVNHAADHSIIDSYDGQVKAPAQYESVYGQPIAWATYAYHTPEVTPPGPASAPISAPVATPTLARPAPTTPAPAAPKQIYLPPSVWIWHVYKPGGPYTLPYAIGALDPKLYNGLTYTIESSPVPNVYIIHTADAFQGLHDVAIYAGPDTVAQFPEGHGEGESTDTGVPVAEVVPAPTSAPEPPQAPAVTYTKFPDGSMSLVTNKDTSTIDFLTGEEVNPMPAGTPFVAVGKAVLANNDTYYMDENSFAIADETQRTQIPVGILVSDLAEAPKAAPAPAAEPTEPAPAKPDIQVFDGNAPADPSTYLPWQRSMKYFLNPQPYVVKQNMTVVDLTTANDQEPVEIEVKAGKPVTVGGWFIFGGAKYWRSQSSIDKGTWYGFPVTSLAKQDANNTPFHTGDDIDQLGEEAMRLSRAKHAAIKAGGTAQGWLARLHKK